MSLVAGLPGFDHRPWSLLLIPKTDSDPELTKYELLGEIGHGGMATVYRARDRRLGRHVAVKVIHRHLRENPEVAKRFASEALAVAKVKHPNIVEVYDVSSEEEVERYLVVELVEGQTLRQLLTEHAPLPPEIAACLAIEVCRALCHAHRHGVIHRDIKPENVLLKGEVEDSTTDAAPRVKLTDFGIAKLLDAQGVTHTGQVLGSPAHMAPEQIEGGDVDARADVFGVGVLLYEMLTGCLPFEGKNPAQVLRRVLDGTFLPAERVRPVVGASYGRTVSKALARDPADRFPGARQMGDALEAELLEMGIVDVRVEVSRFLRDPKAYLAGHAAQIPDKLRQRGGAARDRGEMVLAAACFNRALAYRPDDTALLAEVAGLVRRGRLKRLMARALIVVSGVLMLGVLGVLIAQAFAKPTPPRSPALVAPSKSDKKVPAATKAPAPKEVEVSQVPPDEPAQELVVPEPDKSGGSPPAPARLAKPQRTVVEGLRAVRTPVVGPQNARVRIDGKLTSWYQTHQLTIGPHTFEFVPPNSECCETSTPPTTVEIVAGEGEQVVPGQIRFKPAVIRFEGPVGSRASCGIGGVLEVGTSRSIPMSRTVRTLSCTLVSPPGSGGKPKQVNIDLRPGRTFTLTGS